MDDNTKKEIIISHYESPINKVEEFNNKKYICANEASASCIDNITCYVLIDEKDTIKDVKFSGVCCAISTSSTDIMIEMIKGKKKKDAKKIISLYLSMIEGTKKNFTSLKDLQVFEGIYKQENRKNCATIGIRSILKALE